MAAAARESYHATIPTTTMEAGATASAPTTAAPTTAAPTTAAPGAQDDKEIESILPYSIIATVTQLDNIYETRLFGWVLAKAQAVLKLYNKDLKDINIQHALGLTRVTLPGRYILNPGDKNYKNIDKAFGLALKKIDYTRDNHDYHLNIIAFPEVVRTEDGRINVTFVVHHEVWHALLDFSRGHRTFSLPTYIRLTTKYSVIMYLIVSHQIGPRNYSVKALRRTLGCDGQRSYDRGSNFVARVLDPAREELLAKAPYYFDYSCNKTGRSHGITEIIIIPQLNSQYKPISDNLAATSDKMRLRLDDKVRDYCMYNFGIKARPLERIEQKIISIGDATAQLAWLSRLKDNCILRRVRNRQGYLTRSAKNLT